jgi:hypothetical protein
VAPPKAGSDHQEERGLRRQDCPPEEPEAQQRAGGEGLLELPGGWPDLLGALLRL